MAARDAEPHLATDDTHAEHCPNESKDDEQEHEDALLEQARLSLRHLLGLDECDKLGQRHNTVAILINLAQLLHCFWGHRKAPTNYKA